MKNLPLSLQIWLVFAAITLSVSMLLTVLFPWTLRDFFTREIYATIESSQNVIFNRYDHEFSRDALESGIFAERRQQMQNMRTVNHFVVLAQGQAVIPQRLPADFLGKVKKEALEQVAGSQRYSGQIGDQKLFYVITRSSVWGNDIYLVSYMWDSYREDLVQTLFKKLAVIMFFVLLLSWIPSLLLARYLSSPLVALEKRVRELAGRDWYEPVRLDRQDEIGKLGRSIEQLRKQLVSQDEAQQSFLQYISHDLKTPVMVIRSYAQAIKDGIYPKGDLPKTAQVIEDEAGRLEKRIRNLLYLTKLDYLAARKPSRVVIDVDTLIREVVDRFRWRRKELDWSLDLAPLNIEGDLEQWRVVLENLLDNQLRYAASRIGVTLRQAEESGEKAALLHIWNDGPPIEPAAIDSLFDKYHKGYKGEFGLGLAIVYRIVSLHNARIWAKNEESGVSFFIKWGQDRQSN